MPTFEFTSPDGKIYEVGAPEGATQEQAWSVLQGSLGAKPERARQSQETVGRGRTFLDQALQGATFGFADEITDRIGAGIASLATDTPYSENLAAGREISRNRMQQQMEQRPALSIASNLAGGLLTGGAASTTAPGKALATSLGRGGLGVRAAKGALAGAASGAAYGAGSAEEGKRLEGAGEGAVFGGVVGAVAPVVISAARSVLGGGSERVAESLSRKIADSSGELPKANLTQAEQKVYNKLLQDVGGDTAALKKQLASYQSKQGKSLIETVAGERTKGLAEISATKPTAAAKSVEFFKDKVGASPEALKSSLGKTIGGNVNYYDELDAIVEKGREAARPLYNAAYQRNQSVQSPIINRILVTPEGKSALNEAAKDIANEMSLVAKPDPELTRLAKEVADLGLMEAHGSGVGVGRGLKLQTLDYIKRSMDRTINKAFRAGDEGEAMRIRNLKNALVSEMDKLDKSGLYAKARKTSGDYFSNRDALQAGLNVLKDDHEIVKRTFAGLGAAEKRAYKTGVLKAIRNQIDNTTDGRNVAMLFEKPANRMKLQSILSPQDYKKLLDDAKAVDGIYRMRNQIVGGSPTARRLMGADHEYGGGVDEVVTEIARSGWRSVAADKVADAIKARRYGLNDKLAGEVVDLLYETDPKRKFQIVKKLTQEATREGTALRGTEAGKKLEAFYRFSDEIQGSKARIAPIVAGAAVGLNAGKAQANTPDAGGAFPDEPRQPLRLEIHPEGSRQTEGALPPQSALQPETPELLDRIAQAESGGNPNIGKHSDDPKQTATGLLGVTKPFWRDAIRDYGKELGITMKDRDNPEAQKAVAMRRLPEYNAKLSKFLGRPATEGEVYLAWMLGEGGAKRILRAPKKAPAEKLLPAAAMANPSIFYENKRPRTVREVIQLITKKVEV